MTTKSIAKNPCAEITLPNRATDDLNFILHKLGIKSARFPYVTITFAGTGLNIFSPGDQILVNGIKHTIKN